MWCCTEDLRGFDGVFRYNISQNDGAKHGIIDWRPGHEGSMAYNNTIYLDDSIERKWMNNGYTGGKSDAKFYNNIVVNKGKMTADSFNEQEIDYESNIFIGFDKLPSNDSTIIQEDPMLVAPGTGGKGIDSLEWYKLQSNSPAIDAGINIENNGGKDYFGIQLTDGKTDIGASEYVESEEPVEADKTFLGIVIDYAQDKKSEGALEGLIPVVVKEFEEALKEAQEVFDNKNATEVSIKFVDSMTTCYLEQVFTQNYKPMIINIEWTNYLEENKKLITGAVNLWFENYREKNAGKETACRIFQKCITDCGDIPTMVVGGDMYVACYHIGSHETLHETYDKMLEWAEEHGYKCCEESIERYVTDYWTFQESDEFVTEVLIKVLRK